MPASERPRSMSDSSTWRAKNNAAAELTNTKFALAVCTSLELKTLSRVSLTRTSLIYKIISNNFFSANLWLASQAKTKTGQRGPRSETAGPFRSDPVKVCDCRERDKSLAVTDSRIIVYVPVGILGRAEPRVAYSARVTAPLHGHAGFHQSNRYRHGCKCYMWFSMQLSTGSRFLTLTTPLQ